MHLKQSVCIPILKPSSTPLEEFIVRVAKIGFPAVEVWTRDIEFESLINLTQKYGLIIASMIGHGLSSGGLNDPSQHDSIVVALRESIDIAATCGIPGLICFSGNRYAGLSEQQGMNNTIIGLRRVASYAEKKGVNLNLELLNSKVDHLGYQCDRMSWGREVVEKVNSPRVKLLFDIYHMQIMEGDIIRTIRENIDWIGHFHTAGVPGRHEIDENQELNYSPIARAIAATQYDLYLGHEFAPLGDVYNGLEQAFHLCDY